MGVGDGGGLVVVMAGFKKDRLNKNNNNGDAVERSGFIVRNGMG